MVHFRRMWNICRADGQCESDLPDLGHASWGENGRPLLTIVSDGHDARLRARWRVESSRILYAVAGWGMKHLRWRRRNHHSLDDPVEPDDDGVTADLRAIGVSREDLFVVGDLGNDYHYDCTHWSLMVNNATAESPISARADKFCRRGCGLILRTRRHWPCNSGTNADLRGVAINSPVGSPWHGGEPTDYERDRTQQSAFVRRYTGPVDAS